MEEDKTTLKNQIKVFYLVLCTAFLIMIIGLEYGYYEIQNRYQLLLETNQKLIHEKEKLLLSSEKLAQNLQEILDQMKFYQEK